MDGYTNRVFIYPNGMYNYTTVVEYTTVVLLKYGLILDDSLQQNIKGVAIYPKTYFCPITFRSNKTDFTENTYTIHH